MWWKYYVFMSENRKMRPVEIIPGRGGGRIKENDRGSEFNYDIRTFISATMYPQYNNNIINNNNNNDNNNRTTVGPSNPTCG
jgi:hypothetical protein